MSHSSKHSTSHGEKPGSGSLPVGEGAVEHHPGLNPEKYFRWRGGDITRLEAFSDVVFGFALTLLVVSLEVPHSYAELMAVMRGFIPFAVCFAQLVMIWRTHYGFSRRYGLQDGYTVFLTMVLLFLVLLYVYPLKFVFTLVFSQITGADRGPDIGLHEASVLMRIYAIGFASVFMIFILLFTHAYRLRSKLGLSDVEALETRISIQASAVLSGVGLLSFLVAFRRPEFAGWTYFFLGPALALHGSIMGKRLRLLAEK
jgi:uncharacterized membrane protein